MQNIAIVGVGLIGGSFALALRKAGFTGRIVGVSSPGTIESAVAAGVIDSGVTLEHAARNADLIYLSQPILQILHTIDEIANIGIRIDCLVTDAGSTKAQIVDKALEVLPIGNFLGGHPMAGKESRGVQAADAELFRNRTYVLTPASAEQMNDARVQEFRSWLERIGANVVEDTAAEHDRVVAFTSHLPQMLSTALACTLHDAGAEVSGTSIAGPGLSDTTRLALSDYSLWADILQTNQQNIADAIGLYIDKLSDFRQNLSNPLIQAAFRIGADTARRFRR